MRAEARLERVSRHAFMRSRTCREPPCTRFGQARSRSRSMASAASFRAVAGGRQRWAGRGGRRRRLNASAAARSRAWGESRPARFSRDSSRSGSRRSAAVLGRFGATGSGGREQERLRGWRDGTRAPKPSSHALALLSCNSQ
ncbi:hypothetical protein DAEQUDRAFT_71069 [Daedalea quercina L-15889]|uniref:Uncharacterized protein n=1 Tax=Daedalea quercina L-15889 TaxID=1314783 RepID=A0A165L539_9APHY|nr:hypothetical protein DAEQUDRAFT_71069 [Daedalea quercina L-15889]